MSNLHRIQWIDAMVRAGRYPNCRAIAEKFEISTRQASRDIEYLRDSMGAPIEYSAEYNGFFYTDDAFVLPSYLISQEEKRALSYLAYHYGHVGEPLSTRLAEFFSRVAGEGWARPEGRPMAVYAEAKDCLARYLEYVAAESPDLKGLGRAAALYREVAADFKRIAELVPFRGGQSQVDGAVVPEVTRLVKAARPLEEEAMAAIEKAVGK